MTRINPLLDRRALLKTGGMLSAVAGVSGAAFPGGAWASSLPAIDLRVIDDRVWPKEARLPTGAPIHHIDGDVTRLWYDRLDAAWRRPGFVLAGVTQADALFVLEHLAWDYRRRVVERRPLLGADGREEAISWIIAPAHPSVGG